MLGNSCPETLHLTGEIQSRDLNILIDEGSTHNFIQDRIVKFMGLTIHLCNSFHVMVGNGECLLCNCSNVSICLGANQFFINLIHLTDQWGRIVLVIQWLKTLCPATINYAILTMNFN